MTDQEKFTGKVHDHGLSEYLPENTFRIEQIIEHAGDLSEELMSTMGTFNAVMDRGLRLKGVVFCAGCLQRAALVCDEVKASIADILALPAKKMEKRDD